MTTSTQPTATAPLVKDLRALALGLERDLEIRAGEEPFAKRLRGEYDEARGRERMAAGYREWLAGRVTQAAAAWVLATVFVRYCEDNDLIDRPFLSGPSDRLTLAEEYQNQYFADLPTLNNRDYLVAAFTHVAEAHPAAAGLFDERVNPHNPLWDITPSYEAANRLIGFWRGRDVTGATRYDFTGWDTRFLGDLYQHLSEATRKTYALLQTPEFVEEFILDLTLTPAIKEFGLDGLRTIDPASGSGHFLLGLFRRILAAWRAAEPGTDDWTLIRRSMTSVHGCDKNPFAAAISRFRLLVAALDEAGVRRLDHARDFPINVAVGDSLLHGRGRRGEQGDLFEPVDVHTYSIEDVSGYVRSCGLLDPGSYHAVVANPPYITVRDEGENARYRADYNACSGTYALSIPFVQRLFGLAVRGDGTVSHPAGRTGQITANSFMKREFGKKLVEQYLPKVQLTHVIDCSGAYIPGHGTPTVIIAGANQYGRPSRLVRTVLGVRGEPGQPAEPAMGFVWSAIVRLSRKPASESDWVSVADLPSGRFNEHPWTLSGGGADGLLDTIHKTERALSDVIEKPVGRGIRAGADEAFLRPAQWSSPNGCVTRPLMTGEDIRDWFGQAGDAIYYPYDPNSARSELGKELWRWRTTLAARRTFQGDMAAAGLHWTEYMQHTKSAYATPLSMMFAFVATHNHFVLNRGGTIFNRHSPVIKLPRGASEDDHLALLGVLNSSTACFWLKQVSYPKGGDPVGADGARVSIEPWSDRYEFTGTKLQNFPLPADLPLDLGRELDRLAQRLAEQEPTAVCEREAPTRTMLNEARAEHEDIRARMIALQEELDWEVYRAYALISDIEATALQSECPEPVKLGERAFEIVLARKQAANESETAWFERHHSTSITEVPAHWSEAYRAVVEARIAAIESRSDLALIERPECKRRWAGDRWEKKERAALEALLLDRCEDPDVWFAQRDGFRQPRTLTVGQLADRFPPGSDVHAVAALYATDHLDQRDMTLAQVLEAVLADEHVPYLAAMRYQPSGLEKRADWERTWEGQREEDRTRKNLNLAVPPKYKPADFRKTSFWSQRGKLDVPKERFVSYPGASPDADPTLLLGWAGWDHKDQAQAIINLINDRTTQAGWDTERITPLLGGLAELMPWVKQWHGEFDPEWDGTPAEEYQAFLDAQRAERGLTDEALRGWRPPAATRGRRPRGST